MQITNAFEYGLVAAPLLFLPGLKRILNEFGIRVFAFDEFMQ
jgi:hypothetical protein